MKRQLNMILTLAAAVALSPLALAQTPQTPKTPPATSKPATSDPKATTEAKSSASADSASCTPQRLAEWRRWSSVGSPSRTRRRAM